MKYIVYGNDSSSGSYVTMERCYLCATTPADYTGDDGPYIYLDSLYSSLLFAGNIVRLTTDARGCVIAVWNEALVEIRNNLIVGDGGGRFHIGIGEPINQIDLTLSNNTISDVLYFGVLHCFFSATCSSGLVADVHFQDNIFHSLGADSLIWWSWGDGYASVDPNIFYPTTFDTNIIWDLDGTTAQTTHRGDCSSTSSTTESATISAALEADSIIADPLFVYSTDQGSYDLDPSSPALDTGSGLPDPDGTQNDIGAFGGPDGDWWQEVPWQLP